MTKLQPADSREPVRILAAVILFAAAGAISYILQDIYMMAPCPADLSIQEAFFSLRSEPLNTVVIALTHCGDTVTIVALCALLLILPNRLKYGLPVSVAALVGLAIYKPMKHIFFRSRPDQALHLVEQGGYSFPSGHSVTSVIVYGLLIYLIRRYCKNEKLKNILTAVCLLLALLIGPSRIYVGVHWPTDVICGWLIGGGVLLLSVTVLERIGKNESI